MKAGDIRSSRCTTSVNDTGDKCKKSSIRKVSIIKFGHLQVVQLTYRYFFPFKFTVRYKQSDNVPNICQTGGKFASGVVDGGGNLPRVSTTPAAPVAKFAAGVVDADGGKIAGGVNIGGAP